LGEQYKSFSSSLCNLLHFPVTSSLPGPNILLNTMFSNTFRQTRCYFLFYYTYDLLNKFQALLCPSSGAHEYSADYHVGHPVLGLLLVGR